MLWPSSPVVRIVYRHFPLTSVAGHETSKEAAIVSEMAAERGKFWQFVEAVHKDRTADSHATYVQMIRALGFEVSEVEARLMTSTDPALARVQRDIQLAEKLGIEGTPSLLVQIGTAAPVSVSQRALPRVLSSSVAQSLLTHAKRATRR
jgi:protein-disulfide isomerase